MIWGKSLFMAVPHGKEEFLEVLSVELSVKEWSSHPGSLDTSLQRIQTEQTQADRQTLSSHV